MIAKDKLVTGQERHQAAFEQYYALGVKRSYRRLAKQLGVSLSTVKLWARSFDWQGRLREREAQTARKIADQTLHSDITDLDRNQKIVEMALVRLAKAIAEGKIRMQLSDLDRLLRLLAFIENQRDQRDPERPKTSEEFVDRYMEYFNETELRRMIDLTRYCIDGTASAEEIDEALKKPTAEES